jgi:hypothetical protein
MKHLLGDFNAKLGREDILQPTIWYESLHEDINENGVGVVNFSMCKNVIVESTMFPSRNINKFTWTSVGKTHNQTDHILISSILDVRSFTAANCEICMVQKYELFTSCEH